MNNINKATSRCQWLLIISTLICSPFAAQATPKVDVNSLNSVAIGTSVMSQDNYQPQAETKMYPAPSTGMVQHILTLPTLNNESEYLIEIQIGQNKLVDCNRVNLMGDIRTLSVDGWGYSYFQVDNILQGPSTKMMCTDAKTAKFVVLNSSITQHYDSRLPKVFYLPKEAQLRYRVFRAIGDFSFTEQ
ncbi:serine protease inhibitor ecotin [Shewanella sp.]|uniref:serine protease inhibitor ecotin n=1 Tax=Shewanella sp. TaxID=50422 RepID=UPI0040476D1D